MQRLVVTVRPLQLIIAKRYDSRIPLLSSKFFFGEACTRSYDEAHNLIELEAERCSLDSLGAFTDEHYCGPAVTRSMPSDDTHSQTWVGSDSRAKLAVLFIQIFTGMQTAPIERCRC